MASSAAESTSANISAYWKEKFKENPKLLGQRSNEELYTMYLADHSDESEVPLNFKQGLSNVKSQLRGKQGKPTRGKVGRPRKDATASPTNGVVGTVKPTRAPSRSLDSLEEQIDDCLTVAKSIGGGSLETVIEALRKARNAIILKRGS